MGEYYSVVPVFVDPDSEWLRTSGVPDPVPIDWWPGDDIVQSYVGYLVTDRLGDRLAASDLTGYDLSDVSVRKTDRFRRKYPDTTVPELHRLAVTGTAYADDFGTGYVYDDGSSVVRDDGGYDSRLILSGRALDVLEAGTVEHAHELARVDERDRLLPETDLEAAARRALAEPTERTVAAVSRRAVDRLDDLERGDPVRRLSTLLAREYDAGEVVDRIEDHDGPLPAAGDAVEELLRVVEERT